MAASASSGSSGIDAEHIRKLIKNIKETLANVMKSANVAISQNAEVDLGIKTAEGANNKLEKCLEDFYNACDHLQLYLELMRATQNQTQLSMKYTPKFVSNSRTENSEATQTYTEYLSTVRTQIATARELHSMLSEFSYHSLCQAN